MGNLQLYRLLRRIVARDPAGSRPRPLRERAASAPTWGLGFLSLLVVSGPSARGLDERSDWLSDDVKFGPGVVRLGPVDGRLRASGGMVYNDNIYTLPVLQQSDLVWVLTPGVAIGAGQYLLGEQRYLKLDYAPTFLFFLETDENNAVNHDANLSGQWQGGKATLSLNQGFREDSGISVSSGGLSEVGTTTEHRRFDTDLGFGYELGAKTSMEISGTQSIDTYEEGLRDRTDWAGKAFVDYQFTQKTRLGLGGVFGYRDQEGGSHQIYEQARLRFSYVLSGKTQVNGSFGGEWGQFGDGTTSFGPVFDFGASYQPADATAVSLQAYRREQPSSVYSSQNYISTGFSASVRQRFLHKTFFTLGGGYENRVYEATQAGVTADRVDDYFFVRFSFEWRVTARWIAGAFYLYRNNDSNSYFDNFDQNQVGLQTAFTF